MVNNNQGWESWSNHVLMTLEKLERKVDSLEGIINENNLDTQVEIVSIKAKAGVWGLVAGFVVSAVVSILTGLMIYQLTTGLDNKIKDIQVKQNVSMYLVIPDRQYPLPKNIEVDV